MMRIDVISAVPELLLSPLGHSIPKRAQDKGLAEIVVHNLRDYGFGPYRQIDDYPFGGGAGMVLMAEPIATLIDQLKAERDYAEIIYMSPDGQTFNQSLSNRLSISGNLIILCGHYKGIDQRIRDRYISLEISMGDFVLSGGEIAAAAVVDAVVRLLPGVLGNEESALSDSFQDGLLAPPLYTRPEEFQGMKVPEVLTSGHHKKIAEWRLEQSLARTAALRPDLLGPEDES